jgi:hypothetical protein
MIRDNLRLRFGLALLPLFLAASGASAATSFSHTLKTFTGNSTQAGTQADVSAAGFNFFDTIAAAKVDFDASGATFGDMIVDTPNDIDRNYMRTNDANYAKTSFVAEITFVTAPLTPAGCTPPACGIDVQDGYFGLGSGDANINYFRLPDFGTPNASVQYWGENEIADPTLEFYTINNAGTEEAEIIDPATGMGDGAHRVRLTYDWFAKTAVFAIDWNFVGGITDPFVADLTAPALNVLPLYAADGFPTEPGRIYFGGDERVTFKDFEVDVSTPEMIMADFNSSGTVTSADWAILRNNMHTNMSALTFEQAYFLGDLTADKANNHADFVAFKTFYEDANGSGSFTRMLAGVPEPSTFALLLSAGLMALPSRRRVNRA